MGVDATSAILAAIVSITVAIAVLVRRPQRILYQYFATFTLSLFFWHAAAIASRLSQSDLFNLKLIAALLLPPTAGLFFRELLREPRRSNSRLQRLIFFCSGLLALIGLSPLADEQQHLGIALIYRTFATTYVIGILAFILNGLYKRTKTARADEKKRLRFLFYGGLLTLVLACVGLFQGSDVLTALGHIAATFYVYFLYQSILARRLVDLVELLGKAAVLAVLTLVLASVYALLVLWVGTHQQGLWLFNTLVASFVILILFDQVRAWVEEGTAKLFFRQRYELRMLLRRLIRSLRIITELPEMRSLVLDTLHASGRASQLALYMQVEGDAAYMLYGHRGKIPPESLSMSQHPTLLSELRRDKKPVLIENLLSRQQDLPTFFTADDPSLQREIERTNEAIALMRQLRANAVIPMLIDDRILGLLCLGTEHISEAYSTDELTALLSVAEACAIIIENSQEYEKRRERDRLVAIGEMAAGMAHEIRNPLGAIKGAAQCLEPTGISVEAQDFISVIIEEVDRLNRVVSAFLEYARPYRGNPISANINEIINATIKLLNRDALPINANIDLKLAEDLPPVLIDPEQLKQVLINLIQNAIQATTTNGTVTISTLISLARVTNFKSGSLRFTDRSQVLIRVRDNGPGIKPDDLPRVFVPFFTTKSSGTGLGLAICQRIIENGGGRIEVHSTLGKGATFTIRLPAANSNLS
ncbi:MAG: GAF domain-containing protein [Deltaproteobacteria bacterium]|nr:GAF domain-containing protein [Deltaproteobacteria bacterium]